MTSPLTKDSHLSANQHAHGVFIGGKFNEIGFDFKYFVGRKILTPVGLTSGRSGAQRLKTKIFSNASGIILVQECNNFSVKATFFLYWRDT